MSEQTYTNIYFSQEGYSIWFEEFERVSSYNGVIFLMTEVILSVIRYFDHQGEASYQEYLTINQQSCILHEDLKNGNSHCFKKISHYYQYII